MTVHDDSSGINRKIFQWAVVPQSNKMGVDFLSQSTIANVSFKPKSFFHFRGPLNICVDQL